MRICPSFWQKISSIRYPFDSLESIRQTDIYKYPGYPFWKLYAKASCSIQFDDFFVKSNANEVAGFILTKFAVKWHVSQSHIFDKNFLFHKKFHKHVSTIHIVLHCKWFHSHLFLQVPHFSWKPLKWDYEHNFSCYCMRIMISLFERISLNYYTVYEYHDHTIFRELCNFKEFVHEHHDQSIWKNISQMIQSSWASWSHNSQKSLQFYEFIHEHHDQLIWKETLRIQAWGMSLMISLFERISMKKAGSKGKSWFPCSHIV